MRLNNYLKWLLFEAVCFWCLASKLRENQQRLQWVKMYDECGDAGLVCRRCGISRPTLRKWAKRYQLNGITGFESQNKRPHFSPDAKITDELRAIDP